MRRLFFLRSVCAFAAASAFSLPARAELIDAVVATVDKDVVLRSELIAEIGSELGNIRSSELSDEEKKKKMDEYVRQALQEAVDARLLVREAKKVPQLEVTDKELDLDIEELRKRYKSTEDFVRAVGGSVTDFRERRRQHKMAERMASMKLDGFESQVTVAEDEITAYYQENAKKFDMPERVYLRQIFLRVQGGDAERAQARAKLQSLRDEIAAGTSFGDLAKLHSQDPYAADGGLYGWQQRSTSEHKGDLIEELEKAAFALPAGGLSEIVDSQFGVHLLKVEKHEQAGAQALADVREGIQKVLRQKAAKKKYDIWLADLRKRSRVRLFL